MGLLLKEEQDHLIWGIWIMSESVEELLNLLPQEMGYEKEIQPFSTETRRREWLAVRILLQTLCGKGKKIAYDENGKPNLMDDSFHVSISHTKGYVAAIIHPQQEVGIDIERYGERVKKVRTRFMHAEEEAAIDLSRETLHLLLHWSAKETLFKLLNEQAVDFKEHLRIMPFSPNEQRGEFEALQSRTPLSSRYRITYLVHSDFVCTFSRKVMQA